MVNYTYQNNRWMAQLLRGLVAIALGIALANFGSFAQSQPPQQTAPTIGETLEKTVGFNSVPHKTGGTIQYVSGTCFFVSIPDDRLGKGKGHLYTVTNRHVATADEADPGSLLPYVYFTLNLSKPENGAALKQGPAVLQGTTHWYFPSDKTVDLAVLPGAPVSADYDVQSIPTSFFATSDVMKTDRISVGDSVFFTGFFLQFPGKERAEPIYRHGEIAMMPVDPIEMSDGPGGTVKTLEHLYLADAHAFHGNSGSPLFVQVGGYRNGTMSVGGFPYLLIGVVNGFVPEELDIQATGAATFESSAKPNSGILTFVPAQELKELLDSPELKKLREDAVVAPRKQ